MTAPDDMPDAELDAAVAREVMGWEPGLTGRNVAIWVAPDYDDGFWLSKRGWRPSTDIADAFDVVKRMRANLPEEFDHEPIPCFMRFWHALVALTTARRRALGESDAVRVVCGDAPVLYYLTPRAICEAALAAVRDKQ